MFTFTTGEFKECLENGLELSEVSKENKKKCDIFLRELGGPYVAGGHMNNNDGKVTNLMLHDFPCLHFAFIWIEPRTKFSVTPDIYLQQFICPCLESLVYHFLAPIILFQCGINYIKLSKQQHQQQVLIL